MKWILTLALLCVAPAVQARQADEAPAQLIGKPFSHGIITLSRQLHDQNVAPASPLTVIRDAKAYGNFLDRIPAKQISRTRPAPPNNDPLLTRPKVDFKKHTLLILTSRTMARTRFGAITVGDKETLITPHHPRPFPAAHPIHIGTYTAHLIPATTQPIRLKGASEE